MSTQFATGSIESTVAPSALQRDLVIYAADGFPLAARVWTSEASTRNQIVAIVNSGAGIACSYYDRFAAYLAVHGIPTILYDYRGIAKSRPRSLAGFPASVEDWGSKDCAAILEWATVHFPGAKALVIGHSVGGFLTGFAPNGCQIDRMVLVSAHTGYWGDYASSARLPMYLLWHLMMPALTHTVGYFPGRRLHLLEDLPRGVALDWAQRRKPDFWWHLKLADGSPDHDRINSLVDRFRAITGKILALRFDDDPFATEPATNRILRLYANAPALEVLVRRAEVGEQKIGHFGFFRSRFRVTLWPRVLTWLNLRESPSVKEVQC